MTNQELNPGDPYCSNCGYVLLGITASTNCPECGKTIVDVLVRHQKKMEFHSKRYRSSAKLMGLPLIDIAFGPIEGEQYGRARGFIAIGDVATGWLAVGIVARGVVAIGGFAIGGLTLGVLSVGLLGAAGAVVAGGIAAGGVALGVMAAGLGSVGYVAQGEGAIGYYVRAIDGIGKYLIHQSGPSAPEAVEVFSTLGWFYSSGSPGPFYIIQPLYVTSLFVLIGASILAMIAWGRVVHRGTGREI